MNDSDKSTYAGSITGGRLTLVKLGTGKLVLTGSDIFSGGVLVELGSLVFQCLWNSIQNGANLTVGDSANFSAIIPADSPAAAATATSLSPVPEPQSWVLLAACLFVACFVLLTARCRNLCGIRLERPGNNKYDTAAIWVIGKVEAKSLGQSNGCATNRCGIHGRMRHESREE